jgi:hypothetical protein
LGEFDVSTVGANELPVSKDNGGITGRCSLLTFELSPWGSKELLEDVHEEAPFKVGSSNLLA